MHVKALNIMPSTVCLPIMHAFLAIIISINFFHAPIDGAIHYLPDTVVGARINSYGPCTHGVIPSWY